MMDFARSPRVFSPIHHDLPFLLIRSHNNTEISITLTRNSYLTDHYDFNLDAIIAYHHICISIIAYHWLLSLIDGYADTTPFGSLVFSAVFSHVVYFGATGPWLRAPLHTPPPASPPAPAPPRRAAANALRRRCASTRGYSKYGAMGRHTKEEGASQKPKQPTAQSYRGVGSPGTW